MDTSWTPVLEGCACKVLYLKDGPVAQLDRASVFGTEGWEFEPLRGRHSISDSLTQVEVLSGVSAHLRLRGRESSLVAKCSKAPPRKYRR